MSVFLLLFYHFNLTISVLLFEFVKPLVGPKSVQYANGPAGREVHRTMAAAFSHRACADALPKEQFPIYHIRVFSKILYP